jgi:hypothetical protein
MAGKTVRVNLGRGPHFAGYDSAVHGKEFEFGDWLDRVHLDTRVSERAAEVGMQFYANRCQPHLQHAEIESLDGNLIYLYQPIEFQGRSTILILVLKEFEIE